MNNQHTITLHPEHPEDYRAVEEMTRDAFFNHHSPGCDEHYLVHLLRNTSAFVAELDTVAKVEGQVVGNIVYACAHVVKDDGRRVPVLTFGPLTVAPHFQKMGIGSLLVRHTVQQAKTLGYTAILIYGDPAYYSRLGFVPAEQFGIGSHDNFYADALQVLELVPGTLQHCPGRFEEGEAYQIDPELAAEFDKGFPPRQRRSGLPSQLHFGEIVKRRRPRIPENNL